MDFETCFNTSPAILMEGAIGERLKREYNIVFDDQVAMAGLIYNTASRLAMLNIFTEYVTIAENGVVNIGSVKKRKDTIFTNLYNCQIEF